MGAEWWLFQALLCGAGWATSCLSLPDGQSCHCCRHRESVEAGRQIADVLSRYGILRSKLWDKNILGILDRENATLRIHACIFMEESEDGAKGAPQLCGTE